MDSRSFEEVSLGNGKAYKVKSDSIVADLVYDFYKVWGYAPTDTLRFIGPNPVSIERKHLSLLKENEYLAGEKTDGTRFMLFCTMYDDKNVVFLVNRKLEFFMVPMNLFEGVYQGTIIDLELVQGATWFVNVFDLVALCGKNLTHEQFQTRFDAAIEFMKMVFPSDSDPFHFKTKAWYRMQDFDQLVEFTKTVDYKTDGYIFMPVNEPVRCFRHHTLFKWKPRLKNTVDFRITKKDMFEFIFQVFDKGSYVVVQTLKLKPSIIHTEISKILGDGKECIVECGWVDETNSWVPKQVRRDKAHPNDRRTFVGTVVNIRENIKLEEFM